MASTDAEAVGASQYAHRFVASQLLSSEPGILTTNLVAGEAWTFLRRKDSHRSAIGFLERLDALTLADRLVVHRVTEEQETAAWDWLRRHDEREYSFVDATSFRVRSGPRAGRGRFASRGRERRRRLG